MFLKLHLDTLNLSKQLTNALPWHSAAWSTFTKLCWYTSPVLNPGPALFLTCTCQCFPCSNTPKLTHNLLDNDMMWWVMCVGDEKTLKCAADVVKPFQCKTNWNACLFPRMGRVCFNSCSVDGTVGLQDTKFGALKQIPWHFVHYLITCSWGQ